MPARSRFRNRLIRWLGGDPNEPAALSYVQTASSATNQDITGHLALQTADAAAQTMLAGRYFTHAEDLIQRGAADLAAPLYRQAYTLLQASHERRPSQKQSDADRQDDQLVAVIDLAPASSPPTDSPGHTATIEAQIRQLKDSLSANTVDRVGQEIAQLRQQGVQHADLDHLQGIVHILKGESEAAAENFRMAIAKTPGHYRSLVNLAGLVLADGRLEESHALLQSALEQVNPDSEEAVPALTNLSLVHQAAGRSMDEALLVLRIHRLRPGHIRHERLRQAAEVLQNMAEEQAAIEILQWLSDHHGSPDIWMPLATLLERRGDYQAAALVYRRLLQPRDHTNEGSST